MRRRDEADACQPRSFPSFPRLHGFRTLAPLWTKPPALKNRLAAWDFCIASSPRASELRFLGWSAHRAAPRQYGATLAWLTQSQDMDLTPPDRASLADLIVALTSPRTLPASSTKLRAAARRLSRRTDLVGPRELRAELRPLHLPFASLDDLALWMQECHEAPRPTYQTLLQEVAHELCLWGRYETALQLLDMEAPTNAWVNFVMASMKASHGVDPSSELRDSLSQHEQIAAPPESVEVLVESWPAEWIETLSKHLLVTHPFTESAAARIHYAAARFLAGEGVYEPARALLTLIDTPTLRQSDPESARRVRRLKRALRQYAPASTLNDPRKTS